ncbi:MAG: rhodanese-like domain-containing protein [Chloroflexi bacterium]|nr:MAG: rhodanese-like domain-containing protein [Chloroflexota bacterium]MBL1197389.1 rhodanese-like domain-containing protein [Chloroflexota bacterium]NOH14685.1 rhodanese-like domain-containing protein [Chloroflexota bacterium]
MKKQQRGTFKLLTIGGTLLVIAAAVLLMPKQSVEAPSSVNVPDSHDNDGVPYPEVPRISLEDAKARYDEQSAIIVDVRSEEEYETSHIPGAYSLPVSELEARYQELPQNVEVLTYCT